MASLLGFEAQPRLPLLILLLAACGGPITNAPFVEEPQFLDALLSADEVALPVHLEAVSPADDIAPLLAQTLNSASTLRDFLALPVEICTSLREAGPTGRTSRRRSFEPTPVTVPIATGTTDGQRLETMWLQADVLRIADGQFEVRVDVAEAETASFQTVGTAFVDGPVATWRWELDAVVDVLELDVGASLETLQLSIDPEGGETGRRVEVVYGPSPGFQSFWVLDGDQWFAFNDRFAVTDDDLTWPGQLGVVHGPLGGVAAGEVDVAGERLGYTACWDAQGTGIWQGGTDPRIRSVGDPGGCPKLPD